MKVIGLLTRYSGLISDSAIYKLQLIFRGYGVCIASTLGVIVSVLSILVLGQRRMRASPLNRVLLSLQISDLLLNTLHFLLIGATTIFEEWLVILMQHHRTRKLLSLTYWGGELVFLVIHAFFM